MSIVHGASEASVVREMAVFRETTKGDYYPNHTYILSPNKEFLYGYVKTGRPAAEVKFLKNRVRFDSRHRTFKKMK
jgi:hypothetical protein